MTAREGGQGKILDVEVLRAFAILYTLLAHFRHAYESEPAWISRMDARVQFHGGVDLFFVISGFVISKNLIPMSRGAASLAEKAAFVFRFWVRRVFRLWPSSWLWAVVGLGIVALTDRGAFWPNLYDVAAALLQVYNYHAYSCAQGAGICSHLAVGVYWSLSLEEQFYVVLPLLLVATGRRAKWALAALFVLAVPAHLLEPGLGAFFRWEAFCAGVLLGWAYANDEVREAARVHLVDALGPLTRVAAWGLLLAIPLIGTGALGRLAYTLSAAAAAGLVALAAFDRGLLGDRGIVRRVLVWIGARSYSIYLIHGAVFLVFRHFAQAGVREALPRALQHAGWLGAATLLVFGLSELNFRWVEDRFRHGWRREGLAPRPSSLAEPAAAQPAGPTP